MMSNLDINKYIKVIPTRKYKNVNLYLRFSIESKPLMKEKVALLCKLIGDVSKKYPTKQEMAKARDMLYGMVCEPTYKVRANIITLSLRFSFINPKFLDVSIDEYNSFIKEVLYNSLINQETLDEAKRTIKAAVLRRIDKPAVYASERIISIIGKDNPKYLINSEDKTFASNIEKIKLSDILSAYKTIINNEQLNIYLCGDLSTDDIRKLTTYSFANRKSVKLVNKRCTYPKKRTIVDKKDISQSYLSVLYSTPFSKNHKDYFAWFIGNAYFGVLPTSLLFSQVREKMSLCYSIVAIDYKYEGLVRVSTNIDGKKKDEVIKAIDEQFNRMVKGDLDESDLETAKILMSNTIMGIYDDLDALVGYYYESELSGFKYSIEEYCENIMKVKVSDVKRVFSKYKPYFTYLLLGSKND